jgi:hypothetical protein
MIGLVLKLEQPRGTLAALGLLLTAVDRAHDIAGGRFFSATPAIDDPVVDDEGDLQRHWAKTGNDNVTENRHYVCRDIQKAVAQRVKKEEGHSRSSTARRSETTAGYFATRIRGELICSLK